MQLFVVDTLLVHGFCGRTMYHMLFDCYYLKKLSFSSGENLEYVIGWGCDC